MCVCLCASKCDCVSVCLWVGVSYVCVCVNVVGNGGCAMSGHWFVIFALALVFVHEFVPGAKTLFSRYLQCPWTGNSFTTYHITLHVRLKSEWILFQVNYWEKVTCVNGTEISVNVFDSIYFANFQKKWKTFLLFVRHSWSWNALIPCNTHVSVGTWYWRCW